MSNSPDETAKASSGWWKLAAAAALIYVVLAIHAAYVETPTVDEFAHVPAGCVYLKYGDFRLYSKNPPLMKCLMAGAAMAYPGVDVPPPELHNSAWDPWLYGQKFMARNAASYFKVFFSARLVVIAAGLLTGVLLYLWAKDLFGDRAASITTALFCLNPTVLAHAHLATVDVGCTFTVLLTLFSLRWAYHAPSWPRVAFTGFAFGLALLVKFTAVLLVPVIILLIAVRRRNLKLRGIGEILVLIACAIVTINVLMGFKGSFRPLGELPLVSSFAKSLQAHLPGRFPLPLPRDYLLGFDQQKLDTEQGEFGSYMLGEWSPTGFWSYNFVAFAAKTPIPILLLLLISPWALRQARLIEWELLLIVVPIVWLTLMLTVYSHLNIGVRYLLPIYPFVHLAIAAALTHASWLRERVVTGALVALSLGSALLSHPDHLAYFNLLAGGSGNGHAILIDSNLDWGQDLYRLKPALARMGVNEKVWLLYFGHVDPALYGIDYEVMPSTPVNGVVAVSVNYLMGYPYVVTTPSGDWLAVKPDHAGWLGQYQPTMRIGSIWIFDLRGK